MIEYGNVCNKRHGRLSFGAPKKMSLIGNDDAIDPKHTALPSLPGQRCRRALELLCSQICINENT